MAESRQRLLLEDRSQLALTGVKAVDSFDEQQIALMGCYYLPASGVA